MSLIVYSYEGETLITTPEFEDELVRQYFDEGDRDIDLADRSEYKNVVEINAETRVWGE